DEIVLLPALPKAWPTGSVTGIRARGGFELDLAWKEGRLTAAKIRTTAPGGGKAKLRYQDKTLELSLKNDEARTLGPAPYYQASFDESEAGERETPLRLFV